ncbi:hypothetical protein BDF14DRAFT_1788763 [Spinellus fusiger]|nr:hypothetical protein BDF14DRAFT_1788763 [Spinellus fusiger]
MTFLIPDPTLAFVGTPTHKITIQFCEFQARFISYIWSGKALLPTKENMYRYKTEDKLICYSPNFHPDIELFRCEAIIIWIWMTC